MNRSPVFRLDQDICQAPFRAAPEKAEHLDGKVSNLKILFLDNRGDFVFEISNKEVRISAGALNLLWAASYAYWWLYLGIVQAQQAGETEYLVANDVPASQALRLYQWALTNVSNKRLEDWPGDLPRPADPAPTSEIAAGTELFLVAVGWILLHEVGHVEQAHPTEALCATSKQEEHEADAFATNWMLSEISDETVITKRALGIAVANIMLVAIDMSRGSFDSPTHPPSYERLHRNLRFRQLTQESPVHAFLAALIQVHLTVFSVAPTHDEAETFGDIVDDMCLQLRNAGITALE